VDTRREWSRGATVSDYARREGLLPPEQRWLARHGDRFRGARILDLGVGCGRTSTHLLRLSATYIGVDYSPEMVACSRKRLPGVDFRVGDARALEYPDATFDLVVFSFNGLDLVTRGDRFRVLGEVHRVLVPGGTFLFSSHNVDHARAPAYDLRQIGATPNPLRLAWRTARWVVGVARHLRQRSREVYGEGWAILNDRGHNYRLLTYYVSPRVQAAELRSTGFSLDEAIDADGATVDVERPSGSRFIYYSATAVATASSRPPGPRHARGAERAARPAETG
jgi:SAM-dependent methyltransferase